MRESESFIKENFQQLTLLIKNIKNRIKSLSISTNFLSDLIKSFLQSRINGSCAKQALGPNLRVEIISLYLLLLNQIQAKGGLFLGIWLAENMLKSGIRWTLMLFKLCKGKTYE